MTTSELITQYVEENAQRPGPAHARLVETGVEVWALIGYYQNAAGCDPDRVAIDYEIPRAAVEAALAYYRHHKQLIDAQIRQNAA
jgi:uncharacterized protein (DUF433 family)